MGAFRLQLVIFLVSAVGIAYQVALMRIFSIAQWHHFAYMIISIAMLGFGASGVSLALLRAPIEGREARLLSIAFALLAISLPGCYWLSQRIPFETFELVSQPGQRRCLLALYFVLAAPFFLVSACISLTFLLAPNRVGHLYGTNMLGSGAGALGVVAMLHIISPEWLPLLLAIPAGAAYVAAGMRGSTRFRASIAGIIAALVIAAVVALPAARDVFRIRLSAYKGLSYVMQFPDARVVGRQVSPMAVVTAVASKQIRETPGQISNYPMNALGPMPEQIGLFFDAGGVSPVNRFDGSFAPMAYLDYVTGAVAYRLVDQPEVLVVGAGGGTDVLGALSHGARHVTAVEVNPAVFTLWNRKLRDFGGDLYRHPKVTPVVADGRGFLQSHSHQYDLIDIALLDSFTASAAGVQALSESYLYTVEALSLYLHRLTPQGVLTITRWLKTPPRDTLKMFATAVEACERSGLDNPAQHLVFIRSWNTGTIVVSKAPLSEVQVSQVRTFCESRWLDLCYVPGIQADEANRYTILDRPTHYEFAMDMISGRREAAYQESIFYLRPATDDCPHFFRFFRWSAVPQLLAGLGTQWVPFVEWGYITLIATLIQGAAVSLALIFLPLLVLARGGSARAGKRWVIAYFAALGLAYMFLEIAFIQRLMLFLAYPVYAVAVVLTGFLVFSGLGSWFAGNVRMPPARLVALAAAGITAAVTFHLLALPALFRAGAGWPDPLKIAVSLAGLAPLAFAMGIPFPVGLQRIADQNTPLLPWAWGINGCASVVGASLATLIAVHAGFRILALLALVLYGIAAATLKEYERTGKVRE